MGCPGRLPLCPWASSLSARHNTCWFACEPSNVLLKETAAKPIERIIVCFQLCSVTEEIVLP